MFNEYLLIVLLNTQNKRGTNIYAVASIKVLLGAFFPILGKRKETRDSKRYQLWKSKKGGAWYKVKIFHCSFSPFVFSQDVDEQTTFSSIWAAFDW